MSTLPSSELRAFAKLLKNPDEGTLKLLEEQLKTFDTKLLREINSEIPLDDLELKSTYITLLHKIKREQLKKSFINWAKEDSNDLEKGVLYIALFHNPMLDFNFYSNLLNDWASKIRINLSKIKVKDDPTSIINEINHFLFMELGFTGNKKNYYEAENSFIDVVIDRKSGNPILLSVLYLLVTKRIGLPFSGVNMPAHFLVQYNDSFEPIFIDPFNQGEIITKEICQERVKLLKLPWQEAYLSAPTNKQILARTLQNLINIYHNEEEFELKEYVEGYLKILIL